MPGTKRGSVRATGTKSPRGQAPAVAYEPGGTASLESPRARQLPSHEQLTRDLATFDERQKSMRVDPRRVERERRKRLTDWRRLLGEHTPIARQMVLKLWTTASCSRRNPRMVATRSATEHYLTRQTDAVRRKREAGEAAALLQLCDSRQRLGSQHAASRAMSSSLVRSARDTRRSRAVMTSRKSSIVLSVVGSNA
jgi:hypothetical protein